MRANSSTALIVDDPRFTYVCHNGRDTVRHLRLWRTVTSGTVAVVTEKPDDEGMSLTNAAEVVWAAVQRMHAEPGADIPVIEHYLGEHGEPDTFDVVSLGMQGQAKWERLAPALLLLSVGLDAYPAD